MHKLSLPRFVSHLLRSLPAVAAASALIACGGSGGNSNGDGSGSRYSGAAITVKSTSYLNFKDIGLAPTRIPVTGDARAYGDFTRTGNLDLFMAELTYDSNQSISQATPARFRFWKILSDNGYVEDTGRIASNGVAACIHPRKALTADFNGDGKPDVFVACHGYDNGNYPGEKSRILLSQSDGTFVMQEVLDVGYWHGATAFDVDGDNDIDLMLVNNNDNGRGVTYLNNGSGSFVRDTLHRFPATIAAKGYYSIEAVDANGDGLPDLILGGHEYSGAPTLLLTNPGNSNFAGAISATLPTDGTFGIALDFTVTSPGANPILWTLRTRNSPFYQGYAIQRIDLTANTASLPVTSGTGNWLRWAIPYTSGGNRFIGSDSSRDGVSYAF